MVVDQDSLHLEISLFTVLLVLKLDKGVLQALSRLLLANALAGQYFPKAAKD